MSSPLDARADVAKCNPGHGCPLQEGCLRYLRELAGPYQVWSTFPNWRTPDCEGFQPAQEREVIL
jgi:hypothetical protein